MIWPLLLAYAQIASCFLSVPATASGTLNSVTLNATYAIDIASVTSDYLNVYYAPTIVVTPPNANKSTIIYSYVELVINGASAPTDLTFDDMANKLVDTSGFVTMGNQLVSIKRADLPVSGNISIYTVIYFYRALTDPELSYTLTINQSATKPCPLSCNDGTCDVTTGTCNCPRAYSSADCSITQKTLELSKTYQVRLNSGAFEYMLLPNSLTKSSLQLTISKSTDRCDVVFRMKDESTYAVMSVFEGTGKDMVNNLYSAAYKTNPFGGNIFIVVNNFGPESCEMEVSVVEQSNSYQQVGSISILLIIMIVLGVAILIALVVGVIYIIRKRRQFRVQPRQAGGMLVNDNKLTPEEIQRYFPPVRASQVVKSQPQGTTQDLQPTQDCVICLCGIEPSESVRVTYCNHIFHKDCLIGWFQKQQNCPYCRENFEKENVQNYFQKIKQFSGNPGLSANALPTAIIDYHRRTKEEGSSLSITPVIKKNLQIASLE